MTVESGSTFFTGTWNFIYSLISGNVSDPAARNRKWIHGEFPDYKKDNFCGFPLITIGNPKGTVTQASWTTNSIMDNTLTTIVTIFSKTSAELNSLNDKVYAIVKDSEMDFTASGINFDSINPGADGVDIIGNQRIHWNEHIIINTRMTL